MKAKNYSPAMKAVKDRIACGEIVWLDAGNGTELQARGAAMHQHVWCGVAHTENPDLMQKIHADNIRAGAHIITTNTFSSNRNMMGPAGLGDQVKETIISGVVLAQQARASVPGAENVAIAGSMSHQVPIKPGTSGRNPEWVPEVKEVTANFHEMANLLAEAGADFIILEMMSDTNFIQPAITAAAQTGLPVWMGMCCKRSEQGELVNYVYPEMSFDETCKQVINDDIEVVGIMHTNIDFISDAIATIRKYWNGPIMAYPDSGHFVMPDWQFEEGISPEKYAVRVQQWADEGVNVLGACCGMGVEHLQACTSSVHKRTDV